MSISQQRAYGPRKEGVMHTQILTTTTCAGRGGRIPVPEAGVRKIRRPVAGIKKYRRPDAGAAAPTKMRLAPEASSRRFGVAV
jgi:hypothetical protein